jgi:sortase (surface protein transpeptidase)
MAPGADGRPPGQRLIIAGAAAVTLAGVALLGIGVSGALSGAGGPSGTPGRQTQAATPEGARAAVPLESPGRLLGAVARPMRASPPAAVYIPRIGVAAPLMRLGVDRAGAVEIPPLSPANIAGWYRYGATPGARGAAVILGHLDTRSGPAVFAGLHQVVRGDEIQVMRQDRSVAIFVVDGTERVAKSVFPAAKVYGRLKYAAIRLVTCGGAFDKRRHSYKDNLIVYGHLAQSYYPPK